jgi:hypothetical protein
MKFLIVYGSDFDIWGTKFVKSLKENFGYIDNNFIYLNWREADNIKNEKIADVCLAYSCSQLSKWKLLAENVIVGENAFLNYDVRPFGLKEWVSFGWNGHYNAANFCNKNSTNQRWNNIFDKMNLVKSYSPNGSYILLIMQAFVPYSILGLDKPIDYNKILQDIKKYTDLPVRVRLHPRDPYPNSWNLPKDTIISKNDSLSDDLKDAKAVVSVNSIGGVEGILHGKSSICLDKCSMIYNIADHSLENIKNLKFRDRTQWLYDMSYCQWNIKECENGDIWDHLKQIYMNR